MSTNFEEVLKQKLIEAVPLVSGRVTADLLAQLTGLPAIKFSEIPAAGPVMDHGGASGMIRRAFAVSIYANDAKQANDTRAQLMTINGLRGSWADAASGDSYKVFFVGVTDGISGVDEMIDKQAKQMTIRVLHRETPDVSV